MVAEAVPTEDLFRYEVADGFVVSGDPNDIGQAFESIERKYGRLTETTVISWAHEHRDSALAHNIFDVSEKEAAARYYHDRAAYLIRAIELVVPTRQIGTRATIPIRMSQTVESYRMTPHDVGAMEALEYSRAIRALRAVLHRVEPWEDFESFAAWKEWLIETRKLLGE